MGEAFVLVSTRSSFYETVVVVLLLWCCCCVARRKASKTTMMMRDEREEDRKSLQSPKCGECPAAKMKGLRKSNTTCSRSDRQTRRILNDLKGCCFNVPRGHVRLKRGIDPLGEEEPRAPSFGV